jgi:hypothetical protein
MIIIAVVAAGNLRLAAIAWHRMELHGAIDAKFLDDVAEGPDLHQDGLRWHTQIVQAVRNTSCFTSGSAIEPYRRFHA